MKKIITLAWVALAPFLLSAQGTKPGTVDKEMFNVSASIVVVVIFMVFVLAMTRKIMDYRIKKMAMENGVPETVVSSLLQQQTGSDKNNSLKWAVILTGLGTALTIIYYNLPLGIHSLAILSFCLAASFFVYAFLVQKTK